MSSLSNSLVLSQCVTHVCVRCALNQSQTNLLDLFLQTLQPVKQEEEDAAADDEEDDQDEEDADDWGGEEVEDEEDEEEEPSGESDRPSKRPRLTATSATAEVCLQMLAGLRQRLQDRGHTLSLSGSSLCFFSLSVYHVHAPSARRTAWKRRMSKSCSFFFNQVRIVSLFLTRAAWQRLLCIRAHKVPFAFVFLF